VSDSDLAASFQACREITRAHARNFYYGLRLTPEPRRSAVYAIYAWMRTADDLVDQPTPAEERRQALAEFAGRTRRVLEGDRSAFDQQAWWPAFAATMASYPIEHAYIHDMLAGLGEDLDHHGYATRADLDRYCYRVGSTVGLTCIAIWGLRPGADEELARQRSESRGRAFQLTNILRDIGQDFDDRPSRCYVPAEDLERHGLTAAELRRWAEPARCLALVSEHIDRAKAFYRASAGLEQQLSPDCAPALWGMTEIYARLLDLIAADPARVVGPARVRLSSARKGLIAVQAVVRSRAGAWAG
jgi:phytoene synthase